MSPYSPETPVGILVAERPARADVLDRFGIDYCCGGKLSVRWYCNKKGLDADEVLQAIAEADAAPAASLQKDWQGASLAELVAHVVGTHHAYLHRQMPRIGALLEKVARRHGETHTELHELVMVFAHFRSEMDAHMKQEEQVLFPLIIHLERGLANRALGKRFLMQQLAQMEAEHAQSGEDLETMARLTAGFNAPGDACESYRGLYRALSELTADTYRHVHKENSILFPRAAGLLADEPVARPLIRRSQAQANRGEIVFAEKQPANPLRDEASQALSHRGGIVSARAWLY